MVRVQSPVWNKCVYRLATSETGHYLWLCNCYVQPALNVFGLPLFVIETSRYAAVGVFLDQCNTDGFSTKSGRRMVTHDCRTPIKLFSYSHVNKSKKFKIKTQPKKSFLFQFCRRRRHPPPPPIPQPVSLLPGRNGFQWPREEFAIPSATLSSFLLKDLTKMFFPKTFCDYTF